MINVYLLSNIYMQSLWIFNIVLRNVRIKNELFEFHILAKECYFVILFRYINSKTNGDRTGNRVYVSAVLPFINVVLRTYLVRNCGFLPYTVYIKATYMVSITMLAKQSRYH